MPKTLRASSGVDHVSPASEPARNPLNARARYFPAWWTYIGTPRDSAPRYRVVCASQAEIEFVQAIAPDIVDADYVLAE
jgi:hypothetical protein